MSRAGQQYYSSKLAMDSFTIVQIIPIKNGRRDCDNLLADANDMSAPNYKYNHCVLLC